MLSMSEHAGIMKNGSNPGKVIAADTYQKNGPRCQLSFWTGQVVLTAPPLSSFPRRKQVAVRDTF